MIVVYLMVIGVLIGLAFFAYSRLVRTSSPSSSEPTEVSSMFGSRVEQINTGKVPKMMPSHLKSESEREEK
ncbi:MAG: hypothetical protein ACW974_10335 [Candidatus Thorarchaeota archaeon]